MQTERKRSINIDNLSIEEVDNLSEQIGVKVKEIADQAANKINELLAIYSMKAEFHIAFEALEKKAEEEQS